MNGYERMVAMWEGREVDRLPLMPITMMFAADQLGVQYRQYASDHRALAEAQLLTAERFGFDYVSCISDPSREASDCGASVKWFDDQPPAMDEGSALLSDKKALARLKPPAPWDGPRMSDRLRAGQVLRERVSRQLLIEGWVEGPCAEAADLRGINALMLDFYDDPDFVRDLFEAVLDLEVRFAQAQVEAGVDLIGIGDAAASLVGPQIYEEFVWPYEHRMVEAIHGMGARVRLHICGNTNKILADMGRLQCDIVDLDFMVSMAKAREEMGPRQILLGNLDPVRCLRHGTVEQVLSSLEACRAQAGPRFVVGAGCEIARNTPKANVLAMRDFARDAAQ